MRSQRYAKTDFDSREHAIYKILVPRTKLVRYVGRTWMRPSDRLDDHVKAAIYRIALPTSRLGCWIVALHAAGFEPDVEEIETVGGEEAVAREAHWIAYHRDAGAPLLNANSGGPTPYAWTLPHLSLEERLARCEDQNYGMKTNGELK